ncbi:hypothetical protein BO94DRAFT_593307 [Aspergillus sclerotioniger CBS 115572]|uniref:Large ribosomal subunit protein eL24-related N-terminal domain-containing protein n=3 Tax=Aspergillus subgen. Circumdati TaxID=2720871 RepID=A0A317WYQ7_9EURO|nr:hypothetical protein BO94DRAFT_593307 [Aspergillus sclerotioniger CBS 115572]PWY90472.1 hypothetical protein BO94DRAFT_593307 [Aspergillus sclerotioniger CBS 115572]
MLRWRKNKNKNGKKSGRSYPKDTSSVNLSDSHASGSESHASQPDSSNLVLSELDLQTDDITTQLASMFRITDDQDDPLLLSAVNEDPSQQIEGESDVMSLDGSHPSSFPADSQTFQSSSPTPKRFHKTLSPSHHPDSLNINDTIKTGRGLGGILKKHKSKTSKKVRFAITPTKIVKQYRSAYVTVEPELSHKPDRSLKQWTQVIPEDLCASGGSGKGNGKSRDKSGNKYDERFPIVSKSSFNDSVTGYSNFTASGPRLLTELKVEYIRQSTACEAKTRDLSKPQVWDYRNIWCTKCYAECPICDTSCCVYEELRRAISDEGSDHLVSRDRGQTMRLIEVVGAYVKDASTFSLCWRMGAAKGMSAHPVVGRARMIGANICNAIRLTVVFAQECKADPRAKCDWHERPTSHEQLAAETASTQPPNANRQHLVSTGCASQTFKMRTYDDSFSGQKIYPGKGKLYVRGDSKIFRFQNGKSESLFLQRKNPRRIAWTVLYRRQHKKGISEEVAKKRTRRAVKSQRAIVGASLDVIKERRSQRPEARAAARQQAIKDAKEKKAANESRKRAEKAKNAAAPAQRIQSKQGAKGSAPKVAAKSR